MQRSRDALYSTQTFEGWMASNPLRITEVTKLAGPERWLQRSKYYEGPNSHTDLQSFDAAQLKVRPWNTSK